MLSSSVIRCVDTILGIGSHFRHLTRVELPNTLISSDALKEQKDNITKNRFDKAIEEGGLSNGQAIIVCVHGDFGGILPNSKVVKGEIVNGFFESRPIMGLLDIKGNENEVRFEEESLIELCKIEDSVISIIN